MAPFKRLQLKFSNDPYIAKQANNISQWLANGQYWMQRTSVKTGFAGSYPFSFSKLMIISLLLFIIALFNICHPYIGLVVTFAREHLYRHLLHL